jgi:hypothetical protein
MPAMNVADPRSAGFHQPPPAHPREEGSPPPAAVAAFAAITFGSGLGAYAFGPVPVQWLVLSLGCVAAGFFLLGGVHRLPGGAAAFGLLGWLALVSLTRLPHAASYADRMPPLSTTPYTLFVPLRFMDLASFLALAYLTTWILARGGWRQVLRTVVLSGSVIAAIALYIYIAQIHGLPEPTRTRIGGAGVAQSVVFTYDFHRAMGTFREPSHLAEWLVVPLLLSVIYRGRWLNGHTILMSVVLLLTGSLTGMLGVVAGLLAGATILGGFQRHHVRTLLAAVLIFAVALQVFAVFVRTYEDRVGVDLIEVMLTRVLPMLESGVTQSNRGYVYAYLGSQPLPLWGHGLGNASIALTSWMGSAAMGSHLSLYLNVLFSGGPIALLLLVVFLAYPLVGFYFRQGLRSQPWFFLLASAYLAWLVMFAAHAEMPTLMFAIIYALLAHAVWVAPPNRFARWAATALRSR